MKPQLLCLLAVLLPTLLAERLTAAPASKLFTEGVRATEPLSPEEQRLKFHLPAGFKIQLVASEPDLRKPMNMAFDSAGRLWVTESREYPFAATNAALARDTIRIFSDFDDNGRARKVTTFATNLNIPIGVYPFRSPASTAPKPNPQTPDVRPQTLTWKCIAWSIPNIWLFEDTDGDGVADKQEKLYGPFDFTRDTHGNQASFRRGLDGWIYATHGFNNQSRVSGTDGHEIFLPSGNVYRFRLDGSRIEHWTHGQVNPFGLTFDPLGNLYSADCHSSPIYQLLRGAHYPSFGRPHDGLGFAPTTIQHSHHSTAICGIVHISDPAWPAEFQGNLFIGNVMTSRINRDHLEWRGSTSVGKEMPDFLSTDDPWFRPVDLQIGPDGALWVADFYNRIIGHYEVPLLHPGRDRERGRIWRIVPPSGSARVSRAVEGVAPDTRPTDSTSKTKSEERSFGGTPQPARGTRALPDFTRMNLDSLLNEFLSENPTRRALAREELALLPNANDQGLITQAAQGLWHFRQGDDREGLMTSCLWLLQRDGKLDDKTLLGVLQDRDEPVRVHAARVLTERGLQAAASSAPASGLKAALLAAARTALADPSAHVQRAAADALAANPHNDNLAPLLALQKRVPAEDTHLAHVVRLALREQLRLPGAFAKLSSERLSPTDARAFAAVALALTNAEAATFLVRHVEQHAEPADVLARYVTHAARHAPDADLPKLAALGRKQFAADLDTQATLFKAMHDGMHVRGNALPPELRAWGTDLAGQLLSGSASQATWTYVPLNPAAPGRNPFAFEERTSADGQKTRLMSSLPNGETLIGILRSPAFVLPKQLSFYLCGHDGPLGQPAGGKNFIRLLDAETKAVLRDAKVPRNDMAQKITWDLAEFAGKRAVIEVTDGDEGAAYAWLAFGRFEPALPVLALHDVEPVTKRQLAGAELARSLKLAALEPAVTKLFGDSTDASVRAAAGRAWLSLNSVAALSKIEPLVRDVTQPENLRAELAAQLGEQVDARGLAVVVAALTNAPTRLQLRFATALVSTAAGTEQLLAAAEAGRIPVRLLQDRTVADRLRASPARDAKNRLAALVKNLPPADVQLQKLIEAKRAEFKPQQANASRGAEAFAKACVACHQLDGQGALVGPQLDGIGGRGLERLLEDILDPNRNVDKAFRTTVFVLKDGETVSGLQRREEGGAFIYALANGQEARVAKADVKERRETETSLMPTNFHEALTPTELNDLLAFLLGKTGK
ncbi:MAG: c-type cytochrome [Verrucomicrobia bacterium]|nr:c-type cytochrome [Verrucomicrobiota bacterium]